MLRCSVALIIPVAMVVTVRGADQDASLDVAAHGYLAYVESMSCFSCRFRVETGKASDAKVALQQGPQSDVVSATGRWARDRPNELYELTRSIAREQLALRPASGTTGPLVAGIRLPPEQFMRSQSYVLHIAGFLGGGSLVSVGREGGAVSPDITPLNLAGLMGTGALLNPGNIVLRLKEDPRTADGLTVLETDSDDLCRISARVPDGMHYVCEVDRSRGFLCREMSIGRVDSIAKWRAVVTDSREIAPGKWFPTRVVHMTRLGPTWEGSVDCVVILVDHVDTKTSATDFEMVLAKGTRLHDGVTGTSQIEIKDKEVVSCDGLHRIAERIDRQAEGGEERVVFGGESRSGSWRQWLVGLNVVVLLIIAGSVLYRRMFAQGS